MSPVLEDDMRDLIAVLAFWKLPITPPVKPGEHENYEMRTWSPERMADRAYDFADAFIARRRER